MNKAVIMIGIIAAAFLLLGCSQTNPGETKPGNQNPQNGNGFNHDWNSQRPPGDFNGPRDFNGLGVPRDMNFDFVKPLLNLAQEATLNEIKQALGLPADADEQLIFTTIREKFPDSFPMPRRNNNGKD